MTVLVALASMGTLAGCGLLGGDSEASGSSVVEAGGSQPNDTAPSDRGIPDDTSSDTVPTDSTTTTVPASDEEQVLAAVDCYWTTIVAANDPPDPDHPDFERCFTGAALEKIRASTIEHQRASHILTDPTGHTERYDTAVLVTGDIATVAECLVDDVVVSNSVTGMVENDRVISVVLKLTLHRVDGFWKVTENQALHDELGSELCTDQ